MSQGPRHWQATLEPNRYPHNMRTSILNSVHAMKDANPAASVKVCDNPICRNEYEPTCQPWNTQSYCSDRCRCQASVIRRAGALLTGLSDDEALKALRGNAG